MPCLEFDKEEPAQSTENFHENNLWEKIFFHV